MANGVKTYQIVINGVQESIKAVDSLNKQLEALESKINALSSKAVNISSSSGGGGSRSGSLSEEEKLQKQIAQTEEKRIAYQKELYQTLLAEKDLLKETVNDQKQVAAQERLTADAYSNTMDGMKQKLADIKAVMQTVDLGDTDTFSKLTKDANELNSKLLEIEKSYGQFGRNVGNYASAAEGFKGLKITVGDTVMEFDNARQALKALKQEMQTLSTKKDMGLISEEEVKRLENLIPTVKQLESSIQDAGKPMDALMDSMQSIVAIAQTGKGIAAFFGLDGTDIEKSIQDLVALQNAMQGLQTIQKQMQAGDGIFKWLNIGNTAIDNFTKKLFGVNKATTEVTTATKAQAAATNSVATASKAATAAEAAQTTTTAGLTVGMKAATVAATALKVVLTTLGIGIVTAAIAGLMDLAKSLFSESEAEKKAAQEAEELKQRIEEQRKSFIDASAQYYNTASRIDHLRTEYIKTNDQLKKTSILKEASKEFKNLGISVKSVSDAETILVKQGQDVIELLRIQGNVAAISAMRMEAFKKSFNIMMEEGYGAEAAAILATRNTDVQEYDKLLDKYSEKVANLKESLKIDGEVFNQTKSEVFDFEKELFNLRLKMMKDGLNKRLIQLDEERRQTLTKLKSNQEAYLEAEKIFEQRRNELIISAREELSKELAKLEEKNYTDRLSIQKQQIQNEIDNYTYLLSTFGEPPTATVTPRYNVISSTTTAVKESLDDMYLGAVETINKTMVVENDYVSHLSKNLNDRIELYNHYVDYINNFQEKRIEEKYKLLRKSLDLEKQEQERANEKEYQDQLAHYTEMLEQYKERLAGIDKLRDAEGKLADENREKEYNQTKQDLERLYELQANAYLVYVNTIANIQRESQIKSKKLDQDELKEKSAAEEKKYNYFISQYRNFLSDLNAANNSQPVLNQWGIVNVSKTKKNYEEIRNTALRTLEEIKSAIEGIDKAVGNNILDEDVGKALKSQLRDIGNAASETAIEVQGKLSELGTEFWKGINDWIQEVGRAASSILDSLGEITSNAYEKQIDEQEKWIDKYEDLLNKQKSITEKYADDVNSIEDELATARGDRRQHLIDQLNAEIAAQRESAAEQKKLERQKEAAEHKKMELEYNQAVARKKMEEAQAAINASMAISSAAVNKWPIPAIPMIALATAIGAAQIAAVKSQYIPKPQYGDGGVLDGGVIFGKSHKDGGVPILGGRATVEGGEFITNKVTTSKNVELLEYINSSKKKVDLSDMIEFYSSKPRATIKSIKSKFADGGILSTPNLDISEQLQNIVINQDDRPIYVSVVDINNKQADVRRVQALAGL